MQQKSFNAILGKDESVRAAIDITAMASSVAEVFKTQEFPEALFSTVFAVKNYNEEAGIYLLNYFGYRIRSLNDANAIAVTTKDGAPKRIKDVLRISKAGNALVKLETGDLLIFTCRQTTLEFTAVYTVGNLDQLPPDTVKAYLEHRPDGNIYMDHIGINAHLVGIRAIQRDLDHQDSLQTSWVTDSDLINKDAVERILKTHAPSALYDPDSPISFVPLIAPRTHFNNVGIMADCRILPGSRVKNNYADFVKIENEEDSSPNEFMTDVYNFLEKVFAVMPKHVDTSAFIIFRKDEESGGYTYQLQLMYGRMTGRIVERSDASTSSLLTELDKDVPAHQDMRLISPLFFGAETWAEFVSEVLIPKAKPGTESTFINLGVMRTNMRKDLKKQHNFKDLPSY